MPSIFAISDTWFNRLLEDDPNENVVDNNDHIIDCWNQTVNKDDKVYVLGGFGIGDLYHILVRLNGEIHFLFNYFNDDEKKFLVNMENAVKNCSDPEFKKRIHFENRQIATINELDTVLSYLPLSDWPGKSTGTYCFHGLNDEINMEEHNITCNAKVWDFEPVDISNIKEHIETFKSRI
jgi:calcineurin-like phosphoesterase family protein